jgi:aerobic-type carbon monoxide dehydrogenase small subunit (CoxS/CutS family)
VGREDVSLLDAIREDLKVGAVKDGCSPQGQCGCCTVLVDGRPRVACVTPVRRVADRAVTTVDGLDPTVRTGLTAAFLKHGASQCGFCTPGILCRLAGVGTQPEVGEVETALLAHLCRCTGWRTIVEAALDRDARVGAAHPGAARRAAIEGRTAQRVGPSIITGGGGFADDTAPDGCLVAVPDGAGGWAVGETLQAARQAAGKIQGRRSGRSLSYPIDIPPGDWDVTLQTTWVEPAYLEPDASWCVPGGEPASPVANGGAFGGKVGSVAPGVARALADKWGRPVRVLFSREDVVRLGPKRPPIAAGVRLDGTGVIRVATAPGVADTIRHAFPELAVEEVDVPGPPVTAAIRAAGWAEAAVLVAAATGGRRVTGADGGWAEAHVKVDDTGWPTAAEVTVRCGEPLEETVLRSYVTGAAHMAIGWVCSEAIAVDETGVPEDLTIRSFGILRAKDTPPVRVTIEADDGPPVNGSDAAFAAVAAATWRAQGLPPRWPTLRGRTA